MATWVIVPQVMPSVVLARVACAGWWDKSTWRRWCSSQGRTDKAPVKATLGLVRERHRQAEAVRFALKKRPAGLLKKPAGTLKRKRTPFSRRRVSALRLGGTHTVLLGPR